MEVFRIIRQMLNEKKPGVLVTVLEGSPIFKTLSKRHGLWTPGGAKNLWIAGESDNRDSNPEKYCPGNLIPDALDIESRKFFLDTVNRYCQMALREGKFIRQKISSVREWVDLMLEPITPTPRLIILGCGHVGQVLAKLAHLVELPITVVDDRPKFANAQSFPEGIQIICDKFSRAIRSIKPGKTDFVVIVTRGHTYDRQCLETLAGTDLGYLGMIGSKRRVTELRSHLIKDGIDHNWLAQLHSPIGLDIGAETPAEIAISIMAEIIQVWRRGNRK